MKLPSSLIAAVALGLGSLRAAAADRQIEICTSAQAPAAVQQAVQAFLLQSANVPLFKALRTAGDAGEIVPKSSEAFMLPGAYNEAAHNHLVVIGLPSKDPLLAKVWGYTTSLDETKKSFYAEGWGHLSGDIGWVESDRNPFLHSRRIKSAPEDTVLVKISGTSEAGVVSALKAFQGGLLNGFVVSGPLSRPQPTLLDLDPYPDPAPLPVPDSILVNGKNAILAGWSEIPASEYRAVREAAKSEPVHIWRYKYLTPKILEEKAAVRWLGGIHRMAFGNALDIIQFHSAAEASQAANLLARDNFKAGTVDQWRVWTAPMSTDEVMLPPPFWTITVTSSGSCVLLSSLPTTETVRIAKAFANHNM